MIQNRTHTCEELRISDCGKKVRIAGWMENVREVSAALAEQLLGREMTSKDHDAMIDSFLQGIGDAQ